MALGSPPGFLCGTPGCLPTPLCLSLLCLEVPAWVLRPPVWNHIFPCLHYLSQSLHDLLVTSQSLSSLSYEQGPCISSPCSPTFNNPGKYDSNLGLVSCLLCSGDEQVPGFSRGLYPLHTGVKSKSTSQPSSTTAQPATPGSTWLANTGSRLRHSVPTRPELSSWVRAGWEEGWRCGREAEQRGLEGGWRYSFLCTKAVFGGSRAKGEGTRRRGTGRGREGRKGGRSRLKQEAVFAGSLAAQGSGCPVVLAQVS